MLVQLRIPFAGSVSVLVKGVVVLLVMVKAPYEPSLPLLNAKPVIGIVAKLPSSRAITFALLFFMRLFLYWASCCGVDYLEMVMATVGVVTKIPVVVGVAVRLIMVTGGLAE
jgi:hypothetical protein